MAEEKKEAAKEEAKEKSAEGAEGENPEGAESAAEGGGSSKKTKLILIAAVILVVLGGGGAGLYFSGMLPGMGKKTDEVDPELVAQTVYFDMEEFLVNLNNPGRQVSFLKTTITLELPNLKTKRVVESNMPRIRDTFQVYLRELRNTDMQGSAGLQRLREELLLRINKVVEPEKVNDILFKEIIVQ